MSSSNFDDKPWRALDPTTLATGHINSMITIDECRYLQWLVQERYTGAGAIVDAGPLLGGSSVAMAEGLRRNARVPETTKTGCIHSYDLFDYQPAYKFVLPDEPEPGPGESLLPRFLANTQPWRRFIQVYPGDVMGYTWHGGPIEILFIDLAKSWQLQAHVLREFFTHLIPGVSVVIQQDYFFYGCPWIHPVMEALADYLTPAHMPDGPTLGFTLDKAIPPDLLHADYERQLSAQEQVRLMERAARRFPGAKRLIATMAQAEALVMADDVEGAIGVAERVRRSPDFDEWVHFDFSWAVRSAMTRLPQEPEAPIHPSNMRPSDVRFLRDVLARTNGDPVLAIGTTIEDANVLIDAIAPGQAAGAAPRPVHACISATDARREFAGQTFAAAIIDARPEHPWPTLDVLTLLPILAPGAWIILRDVSVLWEDEPGSVYGRPQRRGYGAYLLFDAWSGEKRASGRIGRVGAIRLPLDLSTAPALITMALERPWEGLPPEEIRAALDLPYVMTSALSRAIQSVRQASSTGRPIYVWGAGEGGRKAFDVLRRHDLPVAGFVDRDPRRHGTILGHLPVHPPDHLDSTDGPRPYVGVSGKFALEIVACLDARGWQRDVDYSEW